MVINRNKLLTLDQLLIQIRQHRAAGKLIVFTNGCFDLIHAGHIKLFEFAASQGDTLIVAVNSDDSIRRLKGMKRPIIAQPDRLALLQAIEYIDFLTVFEQDTPMELIERIGPDVLVKGGDYIRDGLVGGDYVESIGGRVALAPLHHGRSTTNLVKKIIDVYGGN